jgi:hypothetical protein
MNTVFAANWENQPSDQPTPESDLDWLDTASEARSLEPRRVHVPRLLVWVLLVAFSLAIVAMAIWGLGHSTLTYGVAPVGSATTARLAQIQARLEEAGAPPVALRQIALAAKPGVNSGDASEALAEADKALEPMSHNAVIASARAELRAIQQGLVSNRYGGVHGGVPEPTWTPLPTIPLMAP